MLFIRFYSSLDMIFLFLLKSIIKDDSDTVREWVKETKIFEQNKSNKIMLKTSFHS